MNILFLLKSLDMGGVEIVTVTLANKFVSEGHNVCLCSFFSPSLEIQKRINKSVSIYKLNGFKVTGENVEIMKSVMLKEKVQIVINQWGLPLTPIKVIRRASVGLDIKIISVYHNMPNANGRVQSVNLKLSQTVNPFKRMFYKFQRKAFEYITGRTLKYNYEHSDLFAVLSESFVDIFKKFANVKEAGKLVVVMNPVTIETEGYLYEATKKEKEILYVGRIDKFQKRVDRVIDTWKFLESDFPEWRLTLVGDGEDRNNVEMKVNKLGLKRVSFVGFKSPVEYYKRASLLVLCSEFEGFPLVLAEAMSFGVVPVVYGSYPAAYDIIRDRVNGSVLFKIGDFDAKKMAERLSYFMNDEELLHANATESVKTSKNYDIDIIYSHWMSLFKKLLNEQGQNS